MSLPGLLRFAPLPLALVLALCLGQGVEATPPPPAPNVCSALACAEVFPVINPAGRGFIVPEYTITDRAGGSEIVADYGSAGHLRLTVEIVDLSECESPDSGVANIRLVRLEPRPYRDNKPQCRRVSLEVEPGSGFEESELRSKLFRVWLTAGHTIGTANGDIAIPVERRIDLSRPE